ncbi:protein BIG GRAIN 1-like B [Rutidosis leptorrhynchoides]|uniref:protein BIG GRAIN 1-like B n=1 Tax=Rutidosis leptorrhynchoides TaxID=125765 RepID=UPI003A9A1AA7
MNDSNTPPYKSRRDNPSFSSTLLDVIYRSIDEKQTTENRFPPDKRTTNNADSIEVTVSQNSSTANSFYFSSTISSSSVKETIYGFPARPKPIRTSSYNNDNDGDDDYERVEMNRIVYSQHNESKNCEIKTKSRAMKLYGYLKKGNQPNSPGGRLASFLISLFSTANGRKSKMTSPCIGGFDDAIVHTDRKPNFSTSSSATSFSRSCLSKTPSSRGKVAKRSVRFYPASDSLPRGRKSVHRDKANSPDVKFGANLVTGRNATTRNLLKNYQKKVEYVFDSIKNNVNVNGESESDNDDASYASSDLFELDHHLTDIGIGSCMQELPLYETTSVDVNRAIANGLSQL